MNTIKEQTEIALKALNELTDALKKIMEYEGDD